MSAFNILIMESVKKYPINHRDLYTSILASVFRLRIGNRSFLLNPNEFFNREDQSRLVALAKADHHNRLKISDDYLSDTEEYYFERNTSVASPIIDYYITGKF